ncbi:hypothetical protein [Sulfurisphaera ohwakuensis]|uniref:hypothetical protein n=1 Tax=Sulfurisphaera ohwakuensis TaxID=69656 RepID=UPI0036F3F9FC
MSSILYWIYLYETKFSNQDERIQELFFKRCEDLGYPIGKIKKTEEEKEPIIIVQHIEEKREEEEEKPNEFEELFKQFEEFLNKFILTEDNKTKNNVYLVTKPLAKQLFQYLDRLVELSEGSVRQELIGLEKYLRETPLNEKNFNQNNLPEAVIPLAGYDKIHETLGKVKAHLRH